MDGRSGAESDSGGDRGAAAVPARTGVAADVATRRPTTPPRQAARPRRRAAAAVAATVPQRRTTRPRVAAAASRGRPRAAVGAARGGAGDRNPELPDRHREGRPASVEAAAASLVPKSPPPKPRIGDSIPPEVLRQIEAKQSGDDDRQGDAAGRRRRQEAAPAPWRPGSLRCEDPPAGAAGPAERRGQGHRPAGRGADRPRADRARRGDARASSRPRAQGPRRRALLDVRPRGADGHPDRRARGPQPHRALRVAAVRRRLADPRQRLPGPRAERAPGHGGGVRRHRHAQERRAVPRRRPLRPRGHRAIGQGRQGQRPAAHRGRAQGGPDDPLPGHEEPDRRQGRPPHPRGVAAGSVRRADPQLVDLRHLEAPARRRAQATARRSSTGSSRPSTA